MLREGTGGAAGAQDLEQGRGATVRERGSGDRAGSAARPA